MVIEEATESLETANPTDAPRRRRTVDEFMPEPLVIALAVVVARGGVDGAVLDGSAHTGVTRLGCRDADWRIKKMETKWGACSVDARRIWLNLELVKKPVRCLEYLIVHELVHLVERRHNDFFTQMMDQHLPLWRQHRHELNSAPLAHYLTADRNLSPANILSSC